MPQVFFTLWSSDQGSFPFAPSSESRNPAVWGQHPGPGPGSQLAGISFPETAADAGRATDGSAAATVWGRSHRGESEKGVCQALWRGRRKTQEKYKYQGLFYRQAFPNLDQESTLTRKGFLLGLRLLFHSAHHPHKLLHRSLCPLLHLFL